MEKIVIIGSPGAGKSSLARELGSIFNNKVYHLDRIFWRPGWIEKPRDTRIDILQDLVREKRWIIDGTYLNTSELHLETADTIIFLDNAPLFCLWRIIKRHRAYDGRSRRDIPMGSTDKLTFILIMKVLVFPFRGRRTLKKNLRNYKSKQIIWLRSPKDVENFLAQLESYGYKKRQISKTHSGARKRQLAAARL